MTRANDCAEQFHIHVGLCQRAGYANGLKDAEEAADLLAATPGEGAALSEDEAGGVSGATDAVQVVTEVLHKNCCIEDEMCSWLAEVELTPCRDEDGRWKYLGHERAIVDGLRAAGLLALPPGASA